MALGLSWAERIRNVSRKKAVIWFTVMTYMVHQPLIFSSNKDSPAIVVSDPNNGSVKKVYHELVWDRNNGNEKPMYGAVEIDLHIDKQFTINFSPQNKMSHIGFTFSPDFVKTKPEETTKLKKNIRDSIEKEFKVIKDDLLNQLKTQLARNGIVVEKLNKNQLEKLLKYLLAIQNQEFASNPIVDTITFEGYTCWLGGYQKNMSLSEKRAALAREISKEEFKSAFKKFFGMAIDIDSLGNVSYIGGGPDLESQISRDLTESVLTNFWDYVNMNPDLKQDIINLGFSNFIRDKKVSLNSVADVDNMHRIIKLVSNKGSKHYTFYVKNIKDRLKDLRRVDMSATFKFSFNIPIMINKLLKSQEKASQQVFADNIKPETTTTIVDPPPPGGESKCTSRAYDQKIKQQEAIFKSLGKKKPNLPRAEPGKIKGKATRGGRN